MQLEERASSDASLLNLATFYMLSGRTERARSLVEKVLRSATDNTTAQTLLGWIMVGQQIADEDDDLNDTEELYDALSHFDLAISQDPTDLEVRRLRSTAISTLHHRCLDGLAVKHALQLAIGKRLCTWLLHCQCQITVLGGMSSYLPKTLNTW